MSDYIKRENAKRAVWGCARDTGIDEAPFEYAEGLLEDVPSEDVAPVRHGHWIINGVRKYRLSDGETAYVPEYECSWCGFTTESYVRLDEPIMPEDADFPKYCEYCGAKMDGGDTDEIDRR